MDIRLGSLHFPEGSPRQDEKFTPQPARPNIEYSEDSFIWTGQPRRALTYAKRGNGYAGSADLLDQIDLPPIDQWGAIDERHLYSVDIDPRIHILAPITAVPSQYRAIG